MTESYSVKWHRKHVKHYVFTLYKSVDNDIIEWLNKQPSKSAYLTELILADIKREQKNAARAEKRKASKK